MKILAGVLLAFCLVLTGCETLDKYVGSHDKPGPVENFVDAIGGVVGGTPLAPIAGGLSILINLYQAVRGRKYREGLEGVVVGVDRALEAGAKADVTKEALYGAIRSAVREVAGDAKAVEGLVSAIKARERA